MKSGDLWFCRYAWIKLEWSTLSGIGGPLLEQAQAVLILYVEGIHMECLVGDQIHLVDRHDFNLMCQREL